MLLINLIIKNGLRRYTAHDDALIYFYFNISILADKFLCGVVNLYR